MRMQSKKPKVRISPNPIICMHHGQWDDQTVCFGSTSDYAHVDCWRAHFGLEKKK